MNAQGGPPQILRVTSPAGTRMIRPRPGSPPAGIPADAEAAEAEVDDADTFAGAAPAECQSWWRFAEAAAILWGWGWQLWQVPGGVWILDVHFPGGGRQRHAWDASGGQIHAAEFPPTGTEGGHVT